MADDDLLDQQKALKARADATRADAAQLRQQLGEAFPDGATELGITRDRAVRAKALADHAVQEADTQVTTLTVNTKAYRADLSTTEAAIAAAVAKGDGDAHDTAELRERADGYRNMIQEGDARVHSARLDAAAARETAGSAERTAMEADLAYDEHYDAVTAAERQIDLIEQRADLIEQARMKLLEAEVLYSDPPADADMDKWIGEKATLEVAAEDLVQQAEAIHVDRRIIALVIPTADDPPPPDDGLMHPDDESSGPSTALEATDALGLDLLEPDTRSVPDIEAAPDAEAESEPEPEPEPDAAADVEAVSAPTDGTPASDAAASTDTVTDLPDQDAAEWLGRLDDTITDTTDTVWAGIDTEDDTFGGTGQDHSLDSLDTDLGADASDDFGADGF